jgi:hypothetical protein
VDQRRGVERVARGFGRHPRSGEFPQLVIHKREQVGRGVAVTGLGGFEEASDLGHAFECKRRAIPDNSKAEVKAWPLPVSP